MEKAENLQNRIDADLGLRARRRGLVSISIILLLIQFSGAEIAEANTFLVKVSFGNPNGIGVIISISIAFLLIRYYSYARQYHDELFELWSQRMLSEKYIFVNPYEDEAFGLIIELAPKCVLVDRWEQEREGEHYYWSYKYVCSFPFRRLIQYDWFHEVEDQMEKKKILGHIGLVKYITLLYTEAKYQTKSLIINRENLDVYAPYLIGFSALVSYFFSGQLTVLIRMVAGA